ncbi:hypothetical protein [Streptomyces sp. NPDC127112]|uniref:hypothetical protein n=1 Tax=Streptomyces sp. NPDC127112 TaxID=3345364 RepID=UPI00363D59D3
MDSENTAIEEPAAARGAVAITTNRRGALLLHLRDDLPEIAWPAQLTGPFWAAAVTPESPLPTRSSASSTKKRA